MIIVFVALFVDEMRGTIFCHVCRINTLRNIIHYRNDDSNLDSESQRFGFVPSEFGEIHVCERSHSR